MMMKREDMAPLEQEVRPWLDKLGVSLQSYRYLPPSLKILLRGLVCPPYESASKEQLRDLYRRLHPQGTRVREKIDADVVDYITGDELEEYFRPMTSREKLTYLDKF